MIRRGRTALFGVLDGDPPIEALPLPRVGPITENRSVGGYAAYCFYICNRACTYPEDMRVVLHVKKKSLPTTAMVFLPYLSGSPFP
jgi:hypothetical protein